MPDPEHLTETQHWSFDGPGGDGPKDAGLPTAIGRYRIEALLGRGGFGRVYRALDDELQRTVAIKLPHRERLSSPDDVAAFQSEARIVAGLDHPHIVPVHDIGRTDDGLLFVVSKFIEGRDLARVLKDGRPPFDWSAELVLHIAAALEHAHQRGLVHRDIKPGNILVDVSGRPYVTDFGLALRRQDLGTGGRYMGTPAYMSPEQARGEGHRVDARSDVYSLGSVLYELLTGRRPYSSDSTLELLAQVEKGEFHPPRECDPQVPEELERICLKALAREPDERYASARDMADDLRQLLTLAGRDVSTTRLSGYPVSAAGSLARRAGDSQQLATPGPSTPRDAWLTPRSGSASTTSPKTPSERARRRLEERTVLWNARPESRQLPNLWELMSIARHTDRREWTDAQRGMIRSAIRTMLLRAAVIVTLVIGLALAGITMRRQAEQRRQLERAETMLDRLLDADIEQVPSVVVDLAPQREMIDPLLRRELATLPENSPRRARAALGLLPVDASVSGQLVEPLLTADAREFPVLVGALALHREQVAGELWSVLLDGDADESRRLRAAAALAEYVPEDNRWQRLAADAAALLTAQPPPGLAFWQQRLRPVGDVLIEPLLGIMRSTDGEAADARSAAFAILTDYAARQPAPLVELLLIGGDAHFGEIATLLGQNDTSQAVALLEEALHGRDSPDGQGDAPSTYAGRQVLAATALYALRRPESLWPLLSQNDDPTLRSELIARVGRLGVDPQALIKRLELEPRPSAQSAIVLTLAGFGDNRLTEAQENSLVVRLLGLYRDSRDAGRRSAAGWLLRRWGRHSKLEEADLDLRTGQCEGRRLWYLARNGSTLAVFEGPVEYLYGPEPDQPGVDAAQPQTPVRIPRTFAIATREVTVDEFDKFLIESPAVRAARQGGPGSRGDALPQTAVSWYEAAAYCRWLSEREQVAEDQMCYLPVAEIVNGMTVPADYLERTGYRLPTAVEWEYACRAGSQTPWSHGDSEELLADYAWHRDTSDGRPHPPAQLMPNAYGLFDVHGNVWEWCHDEYRSPGAWSHLTTRLWGAIGRAAEDTGQAEPVTDMTVRVLRGGAYNDRALATRSAEQFWLSPGARYPMVGFRVARTMPREAIKSSRGRDASASSRGGAGSARQSAREL